MNCIPLIKILGAICSRPNRNAVSVSVLVFVWFSLFFTSRGLTQTPTTVIMDTTQLDTTKLLPSSIKIPDSSKTDTVITYWEAKGKTPYIGLLGTISFSQWDQKNLAANDADKMQAFFARNDSSTANRTYIDGTDTTTFVKVRSGKTLQNHDPVWVMFSAGLELGVPITQYFDFFVGTMATARESEAIVSYIHPITRQGNDTLYQVIEENQVRKMGANWQAVSIGTRLYLPPEIFSLNDKDVIDLAFNVWYPVMSPEFYVNGGTWTGLDGTVVSTPGGQVPLNADWGMFAGWRVALGYTLKKFSFGYVHSAIAYSTWQWKNNDMQWNQIFLDAKSEPISLSFHQIEFVFSFRWGKMYPL